MELDTIIRRIAVANAPTPASVNAIVRVRPEVAGTCWLALLKGTCPYGHEWQAVSSLDDTIELPLITYGGTDHLTISLNARESWQAGRLDELSPADTEGVFDDFSDLDEEDW